MKWRVGTSAEQGGGIVEWGGVGERAAVENEERLQRDFQLGLKL